MTDINPGQFGEALNWKADRDLKNLDNTGTGFIIQTGTVIIWPGTTVPDGYLLCDGSAISRTTYAALFAVIGTTYGEGDSSGTFNLPNISNIVTSVNSSVPIAGTGKCLGLQNANTNFGLGSYVTSTASWGCQAFTGLYGANKGTGISGTVNQSQGLGVTTNASYSGITGTVTYTNFTSSFCIKY